MKEAAKTFEQKTGTPVAVTAGPTPEWIEQAKNDADLIYSGSETMMTDFAQAMEAQFDETRVEPLYLRPLSILVRPANPTGIKGLRDLFRPGHRVIASMERVRMAYGRMQQVVRGILSPCAHCVRTS